MNTPRERQMYMVQMIKTLDRLVAERAGHAGAVLVHYQRPQLGPGERDAVCVHLAGGQREFVPYGPVLEAMVEDARRWVRQGVGPVPLVWKRRDGEVLVAAKGPAGASCLPIVVPPAAVVRQLN
ncbi:hypothetical protein [Nibricoccus sp. IMCC34717]|uniref:hypothetical protein n=1 Tax=Nibricoccus sp. IMCC34717 TaxID=3034021 RepID=UPI00384E1493